MAVTYRTSSAGGGTSSTGNRTSTISAVAGDLLFVIVKWSANSATNPTCTDDQSGTYSLVLTALDNASANIMAIFVRNQTVASTATITLAPVVGSGTNTAGEIVTLAYSNSLLFGSAAVRASGKQENQTTGVPTPALGSACWTGNPTFQVAGSSAASGTLTAVPNASWTERQDAQQSTPSTALEVATRDSGFTGTSAAAVSIVAVLWSSAIVEIFGNVTGSQTLTAKGAIQKTVNQTLAAKAAIQKTATQTLTAKARVQKTVNQTLTAKASIQGNTTQNQTLTAKGAVQKTVNQTLAAKGAIQKTVNQTLDAKARVQKTVNQTLDAKARVQKTVNQTLAAKGAIQKTVNQTLAAKGAVQKTVNQTLAAKGSILDRVTLDSVTHSSGTAATSATWSHTIVGTYRLLVVTIHAADTGGGVASFTATYNGSAMTELGTTQGASTLSSAVFYTVAPPLGTHSVSIDFGVDVCNFVATAISYQAVNQINPIQMSTLMQSVGTGTAISDTVIQTVDGSLVLDSAGVYCGSTSVTAVSHGAQLERENGGIGSSPDKMLAMVSEDLGGGDATMAWTITSSKSWTHKAFEILVYDGNPIQVLTAKGAIQKTVNQTLAAKGAIRKTVNQTLAAKGAIQKTADQTLTAKASISNNTVINQTLQAKAAIQKTVDKTIAAKAAIQKTSSQTLTAKANILVNTVVNQTLTAKAAVQKTVNQTLTAKAAVQKTQTQTLTAKASILIAVQKTLSAKGAVQKTATQTLTAKGAVQKTGTQTLAAKARIQKISSPTLSAKAAVQKTATQTLAAKGAVQKTATQTLSAKASIAKVVSHTLDAKARIHATVNKTLQAKGSIQKTVGKTLDAKARVQKTEIQTLSAKARVQKTVNQTLTAKAFIAVQGLSTVTLTAKAYIHRIAPADSHGKSVKHRGRVNSSVTTSATIVGSYAFSVSIDPPIIVTGRL